MKLLPIFFTLFLILSSSLVVAGATPPAATSQTYYNEQNFNIQVVNNSTFPHTPFQQTLSLAVGSNDTVNGIPPLNGTEFYRFGWTFGPGPTIYAYPANLEIEVRDSSGVIKNYIEYTNGQLLLGTVSGELNMTLNFSASQYYFDLFAVPYGDMPSWSNLWWGIQLNPLTVMNHWHNQTIYHNTTVDKPYIPLIVYVIIGVLTASTLGFGIQGHEEETKVTRMKRRGL